MEVALTVPVIMVGALATALSAVANQRSWLADKKLGLATDGGYEPERAEQ